MCVNKDKAVVKYLSNESFLYTSEHWVYGEYHRIKEYSVFGQKSHTIYIVRATHSWVSRPMYIYNSLDLLCIHVCS